MANEQRKDPLRSRMEEMPDAESDALLTKLKDALPTLLGIPGLLEKEHRWTATEADHALARFEAVLACAIGVLGGLGGHVYTVGMLKHAMSALGPPSPEELVSLMTGQPFTVTSNMVEH